MKKVIILRKIHVTMFFQPFQFKPEQKINGVMRAMRKKLNIFPLQLRIYRVCLKRIRLCNCLCSISSSRFSASLILNIRKFGAKEYFTDYRTAITIHGFRDSVPVLKIQGCY